MLPEVWWTASSTAAGGRLSWHDDPADSIRLRPGSIHRVDAERRIASEPLIGQFAPPPGKQGQPCRSAPNPAYREWLQDSYIEGGKFAHYLKGKVARGELPPFVAQLVISIIVPPQIEGPAG